MYIQSCSIYICYSNAYLMPSNWASMSEYILFKCSSVASSGFHMPRPDASSILFRRLLKAWGLFLHASAEVMADHAPVLPMLVNKCALYVFIAPQFKSKATKPIFLIARQHLTTVQQYLPRKSYRKLGFETDFPIKKHADNMLSLDP